jgi:hypothetical protein
MTNVNIFQNLWDLAEGIILVIGEVWKWLNTDLKINIPITIPIIFPNGINFDLGFAPMYLLAGGVLTLIAYWVVFK